MIQTEFPGNDVSSGGKEMPKNRVCRSLHETTRGNHRWPSRIGDDPTVEMGRREITRTQVSVLISDSTNMHCDLLRKGFYSVRQRFRVVAFASSTGEILTALQQNRPQVAVISSDLQDGPLSGLRILPEIRRTHPETKILVVTASSNKEVVIDAFRL